ncbi:hypothetical protein KIN20_003366 [Parelaphostrongylus tenuis]|uniref:Uncharacterized protein n=1 Tax=Parelaphostrongylus tenuis TaxID=148309 RepID=A0AAD5MPU5_PARTN|nr:hypothetical protein KIN20_003366 [Parelaphostrongylus tenuis]
MSASTSVFGESHCFINMATLPTLLISMLASVTVVLGCGVMSQGQGYMYSYVIVMQHYIT